MTSKKAASDPGGGPQKPTLFEGRVPRKRLEELVAEALVDCYNESEEAIGLYTMMEDNLAFPFWTHVLGAEVEVGKLDLNEGGEVVVVCTYGDSRQDVSVLDLPLPDPPPEGWEWIEAYRYWARGRG